MAARLAQQVERGEVSLDTALYIVVADIRALTNADGAAIAYRSDSGEIVCRAAVGAAPDVGVVLRPDSGLSGECIRTARPMICADTENDPRVNATAAAALGVRSILMVPMVRGREVVGMIEVLAAGPNRFGASHVTALERVSRVLLRLFTGITEAVAEQVEKHSSIASDAVDRRIDGELEAPPPSMVPETAAAESRAATLQETPAAGPMRGGLLGIGETATIEPDRSGRRVAIIVGVLLLLLLLFIAWWSVARAGRPHPGGAAKPAHPAYLTMRRRCSRGRGNYRAQKVRPAIAWQRWK